MAAIDFSNRISLDIPADDMVDIQAAVLVLQQKLLPHLVDLGTENRRAFARMGSKSLDFVSKTLGYMQTNPQLKPAFVDVDEFARDLAGVGTLRGLEQPLVQISDALGDSLLLCGNEAYTAALVCYQSLKGAARINVPGAATIANDLANQFPGRASRASTPAEGNAVAAL